MLIKKVPLQIKPPSSVVFVITDEYLDMNAYIIKMGFPYPENVDTEAPIQLEGYVYPDNTGRDYYCIIHRFTSHGFIAHEIRHLLNRIYADIEQEYNLLNDELDCYLQGYFVDYLIALQESYLKQGNKKLVSKDEN